MPFGCHYLLEQVEVDTFRKVVSMTVSQRAAPTNNQYITLILRRLVVTGSVGLYSQAEQSQRG